MSASSTQRPGSGAPSSRLTSNQVRGFWASWGGWALDGMDSFIYALVLVPSLRELLPRSGLAATKANIGLYGGLLFSLFLIGWGLAFLWGPVGDRVGRVRTLMLTILWYSLFTFLSALVLQVWQLAILRLLAGIGIGGEWAMGGTFVAEAWPEDRRRTGAGWMHTGYYVGIFLAALANYGIGSHFGWRAMFALGGLPALLLAWIRRGVSEPARWLEKENVVKGWAFWRPLGMLFAPAWRRRTLLNSLFMLTSVCGLWAGTVYVPAAVTILAEASGHTAFEAAKLASWGTMLVALATIIGCLLMPRLAEGLGRRATLALYFALMLVMIADLRESLLSRDQRTSLVLCLLVFPWPRRGQFRALYPLAAGTISYRVPSQCLCFLYFIRPLRRRRDHFSGGNRGATFRFAWQARGLHRNRLRTRFTAHSMGGGDSRPTLTGLSQCWLASRSLFGLAPSSAKNRI